MLRDHFVQNDDFSLLDSPGFYPKMSYPPEYEKLLHGAGYFLQSDAGYFSVQGEDRIDFIQRQTTNDLQQLKDDLAVTTVLTSPTARIIDVLYIILEKNSLGVITLPGRSQNTHQFLRSRIFFNDQISLTNLSNKKIHILINGPKSAQALEKFGFRIPKEKNAVLSGYMNDNPVKIIVQDGFVESGFRIITSRAHEKDLLEALSEKGAHPLSEESLNLMRVESGLPGPEGELTENYTPLETNLDMIVSPDKGCYTGQEVIARQITYNRVTRKMVGLSLEKSVVSGTNVHADGKNIGKVTSTTISPRYGPIALAIIKRHYFKAGNVVSVGNRAIQGVVVDLPFN